MCRYHSPYKPGHEEMRKQDAEIAVAMQLFDENPGMTNEQALAAGKEFIQQSRNVQVLVDVDGRKGHYIGSDSNVGRTYPAFDFVKLQ
jgi:hypothetical protein